MAPTIHPENLAVQHPNQPFDAGWLTEVAQPIENRILKKKYRLLKTAILTFSSRFLNMILKAVLAVEH